MCRTRNLFGGKADVFGDVAPLQVSACLDVAVKPYQYRVIQPTRRDLQLGAILKSASLGGHLRKLPKRRLTATGGISGMSGFVNSPEELKKMETALLLADSVQRVKEARARARDGAREEKEKKAAEKAAAVDAQKAFELPVRAALLASALDYNTTEKVPTVTMLKAWLKAENIKPVGLRQDLIDLGLNHIAAAAAANE
jgi:hypothetical protein